MGESIRRARKKEEFVHLFKVRTDPTPQVDLYTYYAQVAYSLEYVVQIDRQPDRPYVDSPVIVRIEAGQLVVIVGVQQVGRVVEGDLERLHSLISQNGGILLGAVSRHSSVELDVVHISLTNLGADDVAA